MFRNYRWILLFSLFTTSLFLVNTCLAEPRVITIATLDTGVHLNHPDLKERLIPGFNLVSPGTLPIDDNGHGTATVGILVAQAKDSARILPIKVLDRNGNADAARVAEGIQLAVDQQVEIILLSLRDPIYSLKMKEAVDYAESKGVLLVAATGNDSGTVSYPAAFPTVLSVGAVNEKREVLPSSNRGPEVDVVAPGYLIRTMDKDGGYSLKTGTSMAAPHVAGIAALIMKANPSLTPGEIRMILRASTEGLGWNKDSGYGMVDAKKAIDLARLPLPDIYEPNQAMKHAANLPYVTQTYANIGTMDPTDWYRLEIPYAGKMQIKLDIPNKDVETGIYDEKSRKLGTGNNGVDVEVTKGTYYLNIGYHGSASSFRYRMDTAFRMLPDQFEKNDQKEQAKILPPLNNQVITGNFHQKRDEDWFKVEYPWPGKLELEVTTNTLRMDPVLTIEQEGKWQEKVDNGNVSNKQKESWTRWINPGTFFYQINEYYGNEVLGEYRFSLSYQPQRPQGLRDISGHWARESIKKLVEKELILGYPDQTFRPDERITRASAAVILDKLLGGAQLSHSVSLRDLPSNHWANRAIVSLVEKGVMVPLNQKVFPDRPLTRAELAVLLYRAKYGTGSITQTVETFTDVSKGQEAYSYIMKMAELKHIQGFADGTFRPDRTTTRAEFATLIQKMWLANE